MLHHNNLKRKISSSVYRRAFYVSTHYRKFFFQATGDHPLLPHTHHRDPSLRVLLKSEDSSLFAQPFILLCATSGSLDRNTPINFDNQSEPSKFAHCVLLVTFFYTTRPSGIKLLTRTFDLFSTFFASAGILGKIAAYSRTTSASKTMPFV